MGFWILEITLLCKDLHSHSEEACFSPVDVGTLSNHVNLDISYFLCFNLISFFFFLLSIVEYCYEIQVVSEH